MNAPNAGRSLTVRVGQTIFVVPKTALWYMTPMDMENHMCLEVTMVEPVHSLPAYPTDHVAPWRDKSPILLIAGTDTKGHVWNFCVFEETILS
jgi:hypothetical protein